MGRFKIYYGVILNNWNYNLASQINFVKTWNVRKARSDTHEKLAFLFGDPNMVIVCHEKSVVDMKFLESGMIIDRKENANMDNILDMETFLRSLIMSEAVYISMCNKLRLIIAQKIEKRFRWTGAEKESLFCSTIFQKCSYIQGLADIGVFFDKDGTFHEDNLMLGDDDLINEAFKFCNNLADVGQKKLFSLMFGFAQQRNIVYVGGSPGTGSQYALKFLKSSITVYNFDPRPSDNIYSNYTDIPIEVHKLDDILSSIPTGLYDFCWDVRKDTSKIDYKQADHSILEDINELNTILSDPRFAKIFSRCIIKVNLHHIASYKFPDGTRFIIQPYCFSRSRPILELRAVFNVSVNSNFTYLTPDAISKITSSMIILSEDYQKEDTALSYSSQSHHDMRLFVNSLTMRYDHYNFIDHIPTDIDLDISLFCLNRNTPTRVCNYLDLLAHKQIKLFGSFFVGSHLLPDEYSFDEIDLFLTRNFSIFDSRMFLHAKLNGLYFIASGIDLALYDNEFFNSETFVIWHARTLLVSDYDESRYDLVRDKLCSDNQTVFPKFPNSFSLSDNLVSISGHSMRLFMYSKYHEVSIGMFALKVLNSFYRYSSRTVRPSMHKGVCIIDSYFSEFNKSSPGWMENAHKGLWHSVKEWFLGAEASALLYSDLLPVATSFKNLLKDRIISNFDGAEVYAMKRDSKIQNINSNEAIDKRVKTILNQYKIDTRTMSISDSLKVFMDYLKNAKISMYDFFVSKRGTDQCFLATFYFKMDKIWRHIHIHRSFVIYLSNGLYKNHDMSKFSHDEFYFQVISNTYHIRNPLAFELHYAANSHHPEHHKNSDGNYIPMDVDSMREMCVDLAAMQWQFDLKFKKIVLGEMLWKCETFAMKRNVDMVMFKTLMKELFPAGSRYNIIEVQSIYDQTIRNM